MHASMMLPRLKCLNIMKQAYLTCTMQATSERQKQASRRSQLRRVKTGSWLTSWIRWLSLKAGYVLSDHTRNALILAVFAFKVSVLALTDLNLSNSNTILIKFAYSTRPEAHYRARLSHRVGPNYNCLIVMQELTENTVTMQLLEWWYTSGEQRLGSQKTTVVPPPPPLLGPHADGIALPRNPDICPLCRRGRTNPAMAVPSGYVFCYPCIFDHVSQYGCCPVTRLPASIDQIRRLYQSQ